MPGPTRFCLPRRTGCGFRIRRGLNAPLGNVNPLRDMQLEGAERPWPGPTGVDDIGTETVKLAKALLAQSVARQSLFDGFLRQPSWEMLLCLYIAVHEKAEITHNVLCAASGKPSVARTWLRRMERNGLIIRRSSSCLASETVVEITADAALAMECLLQDLAAGLHSSPRDCGSVT